MGGTHGGFLLPGELVPAVLGLFALDLLGQGRAGFLD